MDLSFTPGLQEHSDIRRCGQGQIKYFMHGTIKIISIETLFSSAERREPILHKQNKASILSVWILIDLFESQTWRNETVLKIALISLQLIELENSQCAQESWTLIEPTTSLQP